jgi:hypothetical protein
MILVFSLTPILISAIVLLTHRIHYSDHLVRHGGFVQARRTARQLAVRA